MQSLSYTLGLNVISTVFLHFVRPRTTQQMTDGAGAENTDEVYTINI